MPIRRIRISDITSLHILSWDMREITETQVRVLKLEVPKQDKLMSLGAISSGERVYNFLQSDSPVSLICPEGMVVNGVELPRAVSKPEQTPAIPSPLQR